MKIICLYITLLISGLSFGQSLKKGYEALDIYNYFRAKEIFEKKEKKSPSPAAFGLAVIYHRTDNPFHNIDSAYVKIVKSEHCFEEIKPKLKEKYTEFGLTYDSILNLRQAISTQHFNRTVLVNSELEFVRFIATHPWANELPQAIHKRDSLAFLFADRAETSVEYSIFLEKYPQSTYSDLAQELFYRTQYLEQTESGEESAYDRFITHFPENPYRKEAQKDLFDLVTAKHTVKEYKRFIQTYPDNPHVDEAWRLLYRAYNRDFSMDKLEAFKQEFPDYPYMEELIREQEALTKILLPFKLDDKWGYMDKFGKVIIKPEFDGASFFNEGIAIVQKNGKLGFIDALGSYVIKPRFSDASKFVDGIALVVDEEERYGVVDRTGMMVLEMLYEEIGITSEGLFYVLENDHYAFYDHSGNKAIDRAFDQVESFENNTAIVIKDEVYQIITKEGEVLFTSQNRIRRFAEHFIFENDSITTMLNLQGDTLFQAEDVEFGFPESELVPFLLDDLVGFMNKEGKVVIAPKFSSYPNVLVFSKFKNGHAKMYDEKSGKFGLIDTLGNWKFSAKYTDISFYSDIVAAKRGEFWEFFDTRQNKKWNRRFATAESFAGPTAVVMDENRYGLFGRNGDFVLEPKYIEIINLTDKLLRLKDENGFWIADKLGNKLIPFAYDRIEIVGKGIMQVFKSGEMDYYLMDEDCLIEIQL